MKRQAYQHPELRDANNNIIQQGAFGKNTALANSTNDGWIDYVANDLEALRDNINGSRIYVKNKDALTTPGDISAMYIAEDTGKWYLWDGTKYIETDNARKIADEAIAARDAAKASANDAANSAREQQADWNVTDSSSKAYVKNKPTNLSAIGNTPQFSLNKLSKGDNGGNPVYFLMHELVKYSPDAKMLPAGNYGFNGMVFGYPREGNGGNQFLAIVKVGLGYEYNDLYSSSGHYSPVVIKDETNNKYYWAMEITGSYQGVYMLGAFTATPLKTAILAIDKAGNLPEGWSLVHTAKPYPFDNTHVASADKDDQGNTIATTYLKKSDATASLTTKTLTATDATFTGQTSVPTANAGNSSKAIANTEFVAKSLASLVNGAPAQLNTLNELAKALGNDANFSATITAELAKKLDSTEAESTYLPLSGGTLTGAINTANKTWNKLGDDASFGDYNIGGKMCIKSQTARKTGIAFFNETDTNVGEVEVNNAFDFNKPVKENGGFLVPIGIVQAFAGSTIPTGWLLCDGSAVSRTDYAALYAIIRTTYGAGNGSTTFNLPNLVDKFVEGSAKAGTVKSAGLPNIVAGTITTQDWGGIETRMTGAWVETSHEEKGANVDGGTSADEFVFTFNASHSNSIYGNSTTVQPPALTMRYIIKY